MDENMSHWNPERGLDRMRAWPAPGGNPSLASASDAELEVNEGPVYRACIKTEGSFSYWVPQEGQPFFSPSLFLF